MPLEIVLVAVCAGLLGIYLHAMRQRWKKENTCHELLAIYCHPIKTKLGNVITQHKLVSGKVYFNHTTENNNHSHNVDRIPVHHFAQIHTHSSARENINIDVVMLGIRVAYRASYRTSFGQRD